MTKSRVIFFQVQNSSDKVRVLCQTINIHFEKKERFLVLCEDAKAQSFTDDLLWKVPIGSFLPHIATDEKTNEFVAITKTKNNVNMAHIAFNLCTTPLLIQTPFRIIYEFEDLSNPSKSHLSERRYHAYKKEGYLIESRT